MSENGIEVIENLENNKSIETLDMAKNRLKSIDNVGHLQEMDELWVRRASKSYQELILMQISVPYSLTGTKSLSSRRWKILSQT